MPIAITKLSSFPGTKFAVKSYSLNDPAGINICPLELDESVLKIMSPAVLLVIHMILGFTVRADPTVAYVPDIPVYANERRVSKYTFLDDISTPS